MLANAENSLNPDKNSKAIAEQNQPTFPKILEESVYLRIDHIVGNKKKGIVGLLPLGRTSFLDRVRRGEYPKNIKVGRSSLWRTSDIKKLIIELGQTA